MRSAVCLAALVAVGSAPALHAQDPFAGVTVEPRPSEYLHWDAASFAQIQGELEARLRDGGGIWDTPFAFTEALPRADDRGHSMSIVHRGAYTHPEIHAAKWDIYVILDGSGTVLMGGERVGWIDGRPTEEQHPRLDGAQAFEVTEGDIVHVPARVWHQLLVEEGATVTYALINVFQ